MLSNVVRSNTATRLCGDLVVVLRLQQIAELAKRANRIYSCHKETVDDECEIVGPCWVSDLLD